MSFRYKSALVSLASLALGYGWYFGVMLLRGGVAHFVVAVILVIVLQIVGHIAIAITTREAQATMDERERGFDRRATAIGYQTLVCGALLAAATLHVGFDRIQIVNAVVLAVVIAECARQAKFLVLHHRAA